ncbi:V-set and immunoglobulin domain-containing protein 4 isoform 2-T2 [Discoglossus pictus]
MDRKTKEMGRLLMLLLVLGARNSLCAADPSLTVPHTAEGFRGDSVVLPCTYKPSSRYEESEVLWYLSDKNIFHRIHSQDNIMLEAFRGRVVVASKPGDVSLTLSKLTTFDKGLYRCKVIWTPLRSGEKIIKDGIGTLNVLRVRPFVPKVDPTTVNPDVATDPPEVPAVITQARYVVTIENPITIKPDIDEETTEVPVIHTRTTQVPPVPTVRNIITKGSNIPAGKTEPKASTQHTQTARPVSDISGLEAFTTDNSREGRSLTQEDTHWGTTQVPPVLNVRNIITKESNIPVGKTEPKASTQHTQTARPLSDTPGLDAFTTDNILEGRSLTQEDTHWGNSKPGATTVQKIRTKDSSVKTSKESAQPTQSTAADSEPQGIGAMLTGSGVPLYILLLLAAVCVLSVITLIIVLISRRKRKQDFTYHIATMSELSSRLDGAPPAMANSQSFATVPLASQNSYQMEPGLECGALTFKNDCGYEALACGKEAEYELLVPERPDGK